MSHFLFDNDLNENLDSLDYEIDIDNADIMNYKGYFVENEEEEEQKFLNMVHIFLINYYIIN